MEILVAGRVSVVDADGRRLFQCGAGDAIGHRATFGVHPTMSAVIAEEPCVTMVLGPTEQHLLEATEPELGLKLYRFLMTEGGWATSAN